LAEQQSPADVAVQLNRFYDVATKAIFRHDGTLDKLVGDQVMAFFGAPVHREDHSRRALATALEIVSEVMETGSETSLRVGAGISTGEAFVGNVGGTDVTDYTVLGDTVNVAARLQGEAAPGEILLAQETYREVETEFPDAPRRELALKGKADSVLARVIVGNPAKRIS
jgi:adenylate cyclase